MPLVKVRRRSSKIDDKDLDLITEALTIVVAKALTCEEGGRLPPSDIMIEVSEVGPYDKNVKDLNIRVLAHDYPSRRGENLASLKTRRRAIQEVVKAHLDAGTTYYVWPILAATSYGSDTEED